MRAPRIVMGLTTLALAASGCTFIERSTVATGGTEVHPEMVGVSPPAVSATGRFVSFVSTAPDLISGDTNGHEDAFVHDHLTGATDRLSVSASGEQADSFSSSVTSPTPDGRYVAFASYATNLAPQATPQGGVFLRDRLSATTELVSIAPAGTPENAAPLLVDDMTPDARFVLFQAWSSTLTGMFLRDRVAGTTEQLPAAASSGALSDNGRYVALQGAVPGSRHVAVFDRQTATFTPVDRTPAGVTGNGESYEPTMSADGRYVAFWSYASDLVDGDTNDLPDAFVRDMSTGTTERVSVATDGTPADGGGLAPSISDDGRFVAFASGSSNLVAGYTGRGIMSPDVYLRDRVRDTTQLVSADTLGIPADKYSLMPMISGDGSFVAFPSFATNLVSGDTNAWADVFLRFVRRPRPVSAIPGSVLRGTTQTVTVAGHDFTTGARVEVDVEGVTIHSVTVLDDSTISLQLSVATTAPAGPIGLTVIDTKGWSADQAASGTCVDCITIE